MNLLLNHLELFATTQRMVSGDPAPFQTNVSLQHRETMLANLQKQQAAEVHADGSDAEEKME